MILITGSTGIVGTRILFDLLTAGKQVRALKRQKSDTAFVRRVFSFYNPDQGDALFDQIEWVEGDVLDIASLEAAMKGISEVYHAAALVSYASDDAQKLIEINGDGTTNVVNIAIDAGVRKLCHISSVAALGKAGKGVPVNEETPWKRSRHQSVYGMSKYLAEREVWRGTAEGLPCIIVNPSIIIGPSKPDQSSGMLMALLQKGIKYYPPGTVGLVDVRDVSFMSIALMDSEIKNERFLLNAESVPYRQLLEWSAEVYGNKPPTFAVKSWMLELAWRILAPGRAFTGKSPKITKETARSAYQTALYDSSKVLKTLNRPFIDVRQAVSYHREFYD